VSHDDDPLRARSGRTSRLATVLDDGTDYSGNVGHAAFPE